MSWNLPDSFHDPVAPAKQSGRHCVSSARHGDRSRRLARLGLQLFWRGDGRKHGRGAALSVRDRRRSALAHSIHRHHHLVQTAKLRLGGFRRAATRFREAGRESHDCGEPNGRWDGSRARRCEQTRAEAMGPHRRLLGGRDLFRPLGAVAPAHVRLALHIRAFGTLHVTLARSVLRQAFLLINLQFYSAWLVIAIIWLWGTLLVAGFYPIVDGGYQQTVAVYRAWRSGAKAPKAGTGQEDPSRTPTSVVSATNVEEIHVSGKEAA